MALGHVATWCSCACPQVWAKRPRDSGGSPPTGADLFDKTWSGSLHIHILRSCSKNTPTGSRTVFLLQKRRRQIKLVCASMPKHSRCVVASYVSLVPGLDCLPQFVKPAECINGSNNEGHSVRGIDRTLFRASAVLGAAANPWAASVLWTAAAPRALRCGDPPACSDAMARCDPMGCADPLGWGSPRG